MKLTHYYNLDSAFDGFGGTPSAPVNEPPVETTATPEQIAAETTKLEGLLGKDATTLTVEEKAELEVLKGKYEVKELNEDGTPITTEQKATRVALEKRVAEITAKPEAQRTLEERKFLDDNTEAPVVDLYEQVDSLTGVPVEVDYKGVDPKSAEGIVKREQAVREQGIAQYDNELKENFPDAYAMLLHLQGGGSKESFFSRDSEDYQNMTLAKEDKVTQEQLIRKDLTDKKIKPSLIEPMITQIKDKGKLYEEASEILVELQKKQLAQVNEDKVKSAKNKLRDEKLENSFWNETARLFNTGIKGVKIPVVEQKEFANFIASHTMLREGNLLYVKNLDPKNLEEELSAEYFRFKKGDLSAIATRKAASEQVKKFKNSIKYQIVPKSSTAGTTKQLVSFSEI